MNPKQMHQLAATLREAQETLGNPDMLIRQPLLDEMEGFALMLEAEAIKVSNDAVLHDLETGTPDKRPTADEDLVGFLGMAAELFDFIVNQSGTRDMRIIIPCKRGLELAKTLGEEHRTMYIPYGEMVEKLFKVMYDEPSTLMHAAIGVAGEGGELLDAVKKHWVYNKPLDAANVLEELGDNLFYMQKILNMFGWTWADVRMANRNKLSKRYPDGIYTDAHAQARLDKQGVENGSH